jgi:hypothetical protein
VGRATDAVLAAGAGPPVCSVRKIVNNVVRTNKALRWAAAIGALLLLTSCSSPGLAPTPAPTAPRAAGAAPTVAASPTALAPSALCEDGRLLVGDLPAMDRASKAGIEAARAKAVEWQSDAILTGLNVACQLFESDFRWQATFYSRNAQAFFASDTGEVQPAGVEAADVPTIEVQTLSFTRLHDALSREGFADDALISPSSGVEIRLNTDASPFGPPSAPRGALLFHVAVERLGEVRDVYVDAANGATYRYGQQGP